MSALPDFEEVTPPRSHAWRGLRTPQLPLEAPLLEPTHPPHGPGVRVFHTLESDRPSKSLELQRQRTVRPFFVSDDGGEPADTLQAWVDVQANLARSSATVAQVPLTRITGDLTGTGDVDEPDRTPRRGVGFASPMASPLRFPADGGASTSRGPSDIPSVSGEERSTKNQAPFTWRADSRSEARTARPNPWDEQINPYLGPNIAAARAASASRHSFAIGEPPASAYDLPAIDSDAFSTDRPACHRGGCLPECQALRYNSDEPASSQRGSAPFVARGGLYTRGETARPFESEIPLFSSSPLRGDRLMDAFGARPRTAPAQGSPDLLAFAEMAMV